MASRPNQRVQSSWDQFREIFLRKRRFFLDGIGDQYPNLSPEGFFQHVADTAQKRGLCSELPARSMLYRLRRQKTPEQYRTVAELGPPLPCQALQANRMNPPGIPYFYGADSKATALAEIAKDPGIYALACFETERSCPVLDLRRVRSAPRRTKNADDRTIEDLKVLHWFAKTIAQPVSRDSFQHLEYVPTQVLAEFFRTYEFFDPPLEGIRFLSAQDPEGSNVVLFTGQEAFHGTQPSRAAGSAPWISLVDVRDVSIP
jgi:RES domain